MTVFNAGLPQQVASTASSLPVGSIIQAPYNLTDPTFLPCDYRKLLRATYLKLSACLPGIGVFTATARTKPAAPTSSAIAGNATNWVVTGAVGTSNLYYTPDGITYNVTTTPATCDIRSLLNDGTNFVAANAVAGAMLYSTTNGTTWSTSASATVGAPTGGLQTCMTWASTLGANGRFCVAGGGANFYTSDDRGVTWTTRAHGLGGNVFHVCWTGTKFVATTGTAGVIYTSTDAITWVSQTMSFATTAATATQGSIVSDGIGKVLWIDVGSTGRIFTSLDNGVTWSVRGFSSVFTASSPVMISSASGTATYTNGRFFMTLGGGSINQTLSSTDLVGWAYIELPQAVLIGATVSYKSGVYLCNADNSSTASYTLTEDTTYMRLPYPMQNVNGSWNNFMPFIKVQ